jgi:hypothetical protein
VVFTPSSNPDPAQAAAEDKAVAVRALAVKAALDGSFAKAGSDLEKARGTLLIGRIAYYFYVLSCLAAIMAASVPANAGSRRNLWIVLENAGNLLYNLITGQWAPVFASLKRLFTDPKLIGMVLAGFLIAGALAHYVDHKRSSVFSRYWHDARQDLRTALKDARDALLSGRV